MIQKGIIATFYKEFPMYTILTVLGSLVACLVLWLVAVIALAVILNKLKLSRQFPFTLKASSHLVGMLGFVLTALKTDLFGVKMTEETFKIDWRRFHSPRIVFVKASEPVEPKEPKVASGPFQREPVANRGYGEVCTDPHILLYHDGVTQAIPLKIENGSLYNASTQSSIFNVPVVMIDFLNHSGHAIKTVMDELFEDNYGSVVIVVYSFMKKNMAIVRFGRSEMHVVISDVV